MRPIVFVCHDSASASVMAAALFNLRAWQRRLEVRAISTGVTPAKAIPETVIWAMAETGISLDDVQPKRLDGTHIQRSGCLIPIGAVEIEPGCAFGCCVPSSWPCADLRRAPIERVREARDDLRMRVEHLLDQLEKKRPPEAQLHLSTGSIEGEDTELDLLSRAPSVPATLRRSWRR